MTQDKYEDIDFAARCIVPVLILLVGVYCAGFLGFCAACIPAYLTARYWDVVSALAIVAGTVLALAAGAIALGWAVLHVAGISLP